MKAIDILAESKIDEAPAGALGQIGRKLGSAALGAAGLRTWAADLGGRAEMGDRANQYYTAFRRYLGQTGKDEKTATYADLAGFLKKSNLDPRYFAGKKGIIDPAVVNQGFTKIAQDYFSGNATASSGKVGKKSSAVGSTPPQTAGSAPMASTTTAPAGSSQPFSEPALIKVIPQLNKRELTQINKAVQAALQTTTPAASAPVTPAAAPTTPTQNTAKAALLKPKKAVAV
jgi:hypothetical protein